MDDKFSRLLRPRSIAVFGGSWAANVISQCVAQGYDGDIWPVHPQRESIAGHRCFRSISDLPAAPDASFVGINRQATIDVVAELAKQGAGGAICFASGFGEASAEDASADSLQQKLLDAASDMPIIGPNCYGFINYLDGALLWPDQHGGQRVTSGVALITQSSNIAINLTMQQRGLPIAYVLTAGNQAQISLAEMAMALLEDTRVTAIGLHIEGFQNVRAFELLATRARERGIAIVALKTGVNATSRAALMSHTRSLTGDDTAADAFLQRLGIARVSNFSVMIETLKLLHTHGVVAGTRISSMSCSGGEAALMADSAERAGLSCPPLEPDQHQQLRGVLGELVALANPLDYHTYIWNDLDAMRSMMSAMHAQNADATLLVLDFPRADRCQHPSWDVAVKAFTQAGEGWPGARCIVSTLPENLTEQVAHNCIQAGVVPLQGIDDALQAIKIAAWLAHHQAQPNPAPVWLLGDDNGHADRVSLSSPGDRQVVQFGERKSARELSAEAWGLDTSSTRVSKDTARQLDEITAKRWLARYGSAVPAGFRLSFADVRSSRRLSRALDKASPIVSYPAVAKGLGIAHKSEANAIVLSIGNRRDLERAIRHIDCDGGCLVEEHVQDGIVELLVSVVPDPVLGLVLTIAAGGVTAEVLDDTAHALLPVAREQIDAMIDSLQCSSLLAGFRGRAVVDRKILIDAIEAIQQAALQLGPRLAELEVNPLLCAADRCVVVDALISVRDL